MYRFLNYVQPAVVAFDEAPEKNYFIYILPGVVHRREGGSVSTVWFHEIRPRYDRYVSNSLILRHSPAKVFFIFRVLLFTPESLWKLKLYTIPGRMLLIRRKKSKWKYQNGSPTSVNSQKKLVQKWYIFTVGNPIEIDRRSWILRSSLWETL